MQQFILPASQEAARLGVNHATLIAAIKSGRCAGEHRDGYWYTSAEASAKWYAERYRHKGALYSSTAGKSWSTADNAVLRDMVIEEASLSEMATRFKRTGSAVKTQISKLRAINQVPSAAAIKEAKRKQAILAEAKAFLAEEQPQDAYQECRQQEREGRVRLHLHPKVKAALGRAAHQAGLTLALFVTRAGLAAAADPEILEKGLREAEKLGKG